MQWLKDIVRHNIEYKTASDARMWAQDVYNYGCAGGSVSGIIWYSENEKIYRDNEDEILDALEDAGYFEGKELNPRMTIREICNQGVWATVELYVQQYTEDMIAELNLSDEE